MNVAMLLGFAVLLLAYTFLYKMVHLWNQQGVSFADALYKGCP